MSETARGDEAAFYEIRVQGLLDEGWSAWLGGLQIMPLNGRETLLAGHIRDHAVPNALIPVITVGSLTLINLFNGVVITETVSGYPGMGSFLADAALSLDIVSVLGVTLFSSFVLISGNLVVDVLYAMVDPCIRLE
ncbi:MAG: ABC transporter permease [Anaerolineae bacterium]